MKAERFTQLHPDFYSHLERTPLRVNVGTIQGAQVDLKDETTHESGSFKDRGALNFLLHAYSKGPDHLVASGVVTASAGNHGQGVARAAQRLSVPVHVYVPASTPYSKISSIKQYGATVTTIEGCVDDALESACKFARDENLTFVHPFDTGHVIAGQATVGHEIIAQTSDRFPDKIFVPVGGGGLLAGVCSAVDASACETKVIGVQLEGADAFTRSLDSASPITLDEVNTLSDGTAVKTAGRLALSYVRRSSSFAGMIMVTEAELGVSMRTLDLLSATQVEPAGALAYAGVMRLLQSGNYRSERWVAVLSGNHRDPVRYYALQKAAQATCG